MYLDTGFSGKFLSELAWLREEQYSGCETRHESGVRPIPRRCSRTSAQQPHQQESYQGVVALPGFWILTIKENLRSNDHGRESYLELKLVQPQSIA